MEERKLAPNNEREALIKRLKRIEGQVKGIQKWSNKNVIVLIYWFKYLL